MSPIPKTGTWAGPYFGHMVQQRGSKGQIISKGLFGVLEFSQKMNE